MKTSLLILTLSVPWRIVAAGASASDPAQAAVAVPMLGYYYDAVAQRINPVQGIPGAALIVAPYSLPQDSAVVAISSERDYALLAGAENAPTVLDLRSRATISIPGTLTATSRIVVSPGGAAAALYHASVDLIEIVTGLPAAPTVVRTIHLAALPGRPAVLAVSDDGQSLAVVLEDGQTLLATDDGFIALPVPGPTAVLAFSPGTQDIVVATRDGQIWSVKLENGRPKYDLIGTRSEGSEVGRRPAAVEFSRDGNRVSAAFTDGTVAVFDFTGSNPALTSCGCSPLAFQRGKGNYLFLLQDSSPPLPRLLDGSRTALRLFFIPALVEDNVQ